MPQIRTTKIITSSAFWPKLEPSPRPAVQILVVMMIAHHKLPSNSSKLTWSQRPSRSKSHRPPARRPRCNKSTSRSPSPSSMRPSEPPRKWAFHPRQGVPWHSLKIVPSPSKPPQLRVLRPPHRMAVCCRGKRSGWTRGRRNWREEPITDRILVSWDCSIIRVRCSHWALVWLVRIKTWPLYSHCSKSCSYWRKRSDSFRTSWLKSVRASPASKRKTRCYSSWRKRNLKRLNSVGCNSRQN